MPAAVEVSGLRVTADRGAQGQMPLVEDIGFQIARGEVLALIGESGSGKTTIALTLLGHARERCRIDAGSIRVGDTNVRALDAARLRALRGRRVSYIAQSAAASFNPSLRLMDQVIEPALIHGVATRAAAEQQARDMFRTLALPDPDHIGERYPHQVSGGQLQRLMAAMAMITRPELVILDEPTTALDVTTQIEVLRAFKRLVRESGAAAIYVSHDLAVVAQMADHILVLRKGRIVETAATAALLDAPQADYTRSLLAAARPAARSAPTAIGASGTLLEIRDLDVTLGGTRVLKDIELDVPRGSMIGIIGESGSGKSTLARCIAGLVAPTRGDIRFDGTALPAELAARTREQYRRIQIVFQNADTALNPAHTVARILARPLALYHGLSGSECQQRIAGLLDQVQLPAAIAQRPCAALSGGQKQRINLARALAAEPDLILCDEVTSALDTVVGAAILELIGRLRRELQLTCLFISHDISTVRAACDDIVVLRAGDIVDRTTGAALAHAPRHPYTQLLIQSVPELRPGWLEQAAP